MLLNLLELFLALSLLKNQSGLGAVVPINHSPIENSIAKRWLKKDYVTILRDIAKLSRSISCKKYILFSFAGRLAANLVGLSIAVTSRRFKRFISSYDWNILSCGTWLHTTILFILFCERNLTNPGDLQRLLLHLNVYK